MDNSRLKSPQVLETKKMPRNSLEGSSSGRPRLEDELAGVVAVHREVEQHLSSPADENGGCHDAPVRPQAKKYLEKKD